MGRAASRRRESGTLGHLRVRSFSLTLYTVGALSVLRSTNTARLVKHSTPTPQSTTQRYNTHHSPLTTQRPSQCRPARDKHSTARDLCRQALARHTFLVLANVPSALYHLRPILAKPTGSLSKALRHRPALSLGLHCGTVPGYPSP